MAYIANSSFAQLPDQSFHIESEQVPSSVEHMTRVTLVAYVCPFEVTAENRYENRCKYQKVDTSASVL